MKEKDSQYGILLTASERNGLDNNNLHRQIAWELLKKDGKLERRIKSITEDLRFVMENPSLISWFMYFDNQSSVNDLLTQLNSISRFSIPIPIFYLTKSIKNKKNIYNLKVLKLKRRDWEMAASSYLGKGSKKDRNDIIEYFIKRLKKGSRMTVKEWKPIDNFLRTKQKISKQWFNLPFEEGKEYSYDDILNILK